jgi:hypothetical protein
MNTRDIVFGFASVFLFVKSYANFLVAELSQLCYGGVLRAIALGSTDGLCTWRCTFLMGLQPVIVPVGRIALGRIFNVVGSVIDRYMELALSCQFTSTIQVDSQNFMGPVTTTTDSGVMELDDYYSSQYSLLLVGDKLKRPIRGHNSSGMESTRLIGFWNKYILGFGFGNLILLELEDWIFYIGYLY